MFLFFPDVTAIIYVVACSSYNLVLREDPSQVGMAQKIEIKTSNVCKSYSRTCIY
jgi:hypothetical protein